MSRWWYRYTSEDRAACVERSEGSCEACGAWAGEALHWDHFWGRSRVVASTRNTWMLCPRCDNAKTANRPSRAYWLGRFFSHCERHDYSEQTELVAHELAWCAAKGLVQ